MNKLTLAGDDVNASPVENLLKHLNKRLPLTMVFNETIFPMLGAMAISKLYKFCAAGEVLKTAGWLDIGFGYAIKDGVDKEGLPVKCIVDVYGPGRIILDANGFFNNENSDCDIYICKNSVIVLFTRADFDRLKLSTLEPDALANCILAEEIQLMKEKMNMQRLKGEAKCGRFIEIFGAEALQYFPQKRIAGYLGITEVHFTNLKVKRLRR